MGRVIQTDSPTKIRNQQMRTIAELLRHLSKKQEFDVEAKDMVATIIFALVEIDEGVKKSAEAWEKRDYWLKAERFIRDWSWARQTACDMDDVLRHEAWDLLPQLLLQLSPHFAGIKISKFTRKPSVWIDNHAVLVDSPPLEPPY